MSNDANIPKAQLAPPASILRSFPLLGATIFVAASVAILGACGVGVFLGRWSIGKTLGPVADTPTTDIKIDDAVTPKTPKIASVVMSIKKKAEDWNYQDLQDHLAANGFKTNRKSRDLGSYGMRPFFKGGEKGMFFEPADGGRGTQAGMSFIWLSPADYATLQKAQAAHNASKFPTADDAGRSHERLRELKNQLSDKMPLWQYQPFLAYHLGSPEAAKKEAARILDVEQMAVLAWGPFLFETGSSRTDYPKNPIVLQTLKRLLP